VSPCEVCRIPLGFHEECPSPACPCYGLTANSDAMAVAAERWRSRPSVAASRCMSGDAAYDAMERDAYLSYRQAVDSMEFVHEALP
jgi:hypothetical protein